MWDAGDHAYLVTVDNLEGPDVDIFDISDPAHPVKVGGVQPGRAFAGIIPEPVNGHGRVVPPRRDRRGDRRRQVMSVSYWDGGYVMLDVTDPANATYIADSDFAAVDRRLSRRGRPSCRRATPTRPSSPSTTSYLITADEDFNPYTAAAQNSMTARPSSRDAGIDSRRSSPARSSRARQSSSGGPVPATRAVRGRLVGTQIAVVERGRVHLYREGAASRRRRLRGHPRLEPDRRRRLQEALGMRVEGTTRLRLRGRMTGFALLRRGRYNEAACVAGNAGAQAPIALGTLGDTVARVVLRRLGLRPPVRERRGQAPGARHLRHSRGPRPGLRQGFGDLSVHEVAMSQWMPTGRYLSYYSGGFRVMKSWATEIVEVGHFIAAGGNNFWGVQVFEHDGVEYVLASDRDYGLYIFKYTGP